MAEKKRMERLHAREVVLYKKKYRGEATEAELVELKELRCINNIHSFLTYSYGNEEVLLEKYFNEHAVVIPCSVVGPEGELYHTVTYI